MLKFSEYKWYLGMKYQPPAQPFLSDTQIMKYFINTLISKEEKSKSDYCFTELVNYGLSILRKYMIYDYELFILVYINTFYNEKGNLIQEALDIFDIDKIKDDNNLTILDYLGEMENIYKNKLYHLEKLSNKNETNIMKFHTVYIYFLNRVLEKDKLWFVLNELMDNKTDELILPKLFLSNFFSFYKTLTLPDEIKTKIKKTLITVSNSYKDLINSLCLISSFVDKNFIAMLKYINDNYETIHNLCYTEKKFIKINEYYNQNKLNKEELSTIKEYFNNILTMKKKYNYESIKIDFSTYVYFIYNNYNKEFLDFLEEKLLNNFTRYEDMEQALLFSSKFKGKQFIPFLETISNRIEPIINMCKIYKQILNAEVFIEPNSADDLNKIKELLSFIIEKEKKENYHFIKFNLNIWKAYTKTKNLDDLLILRNIIWICKEVDNTIDENLINLGDAIHNLGLELIAIGKLKGNKLTDFLAQDIVYTDNKIKNLEMENNRLKVEISNIDNKVSNIKKDVIDLKSDVKSLSTTSNNIIDKMESMETRINNIRGDVFMLKRQTNQY